MLLIGHHLLEGKVAAIPKPLAIMHRTNADTGKASLGAPDDEESMDLDTQNTSSSHPHSESNVPPRWTIVGLVKKKIIFSKRPMPVINKGP